ncbi:MAG: trigger factor [Streptomycetales bacterium]
MKSAVETLNPTRVRLTVEVPFEELKPTLDAAYKSISQQVNVPGFRRGRVPARIIDQRFGRGAVLEQAVNDALPRFYGQAVEENKVKVLSQPELDITRFEDGQELAFTAEVDIRPPVDLPEYEGIEVTVDDAEVSDDEVEEQLQTLRDRFASLSGVDDRPAREGDYLSLDLEASRDGEPLEDATANGVTYAVGSGHMLDGLDEAVTGLSAGESATFRTTLAGGEHAGEEADVSATVRNIKVKELPELDDEFAQMASEFDTLDELRQAIRERLEQMKEHQRLQQARDRALESLLSKIEVPLPEGVVAKEIAWRKQSMQEQFDGAGVSKDDYLEYEGKSGDDFDEELEQNVRQSIKAQFVLDALAEQEQLSVSQEELTQHIVQVAAGAGMAPDEFAQRVVEGGQVPILVSEVVRGKALAFVVEHAKITDASGREVDLQALRDEEEPQEVAEPGAEQAAPEQAAPEQAAPAKSAES